MAEKEFSWTDGEKVGPDGLTEAHTSFRESAHRYIDSDDFDGGLVVVVEKDAIRTLGCIKPVDVARAIMQLFEDEDVAYNVSRFINIRKINQAIEDGDLKGALKMANELLHAEGRPDNEDSK